MVSVSDLSFFDKSPVLERGLSATWLMVPLALISLGFGRTALVFMAPADLSRRRMSSLLKRAASGFAPVRFCRVLAVASENPVEKKIEAESSAPALIAICGRQERKTREKKKNDRKKRLLRRVAVAKPVAKRPSVSELRKGGRRLMFAQKNFIL